MMRIRILTKTASQFRPTAKILRMPDDFDAFHDAPHNARREVYGVDYVRQEFPDGGEMWMTRYGWPWREHLDPEKWYKGKRYVSEGTRLTRGTGAVYRIRTSASRGPDVEMVIKFSRFAQDVPLHIAVTYPSNIPRHLVDNSRFNSPFYEFGQIKKIRAPTETGLPRIMTGRPLAIYSPPAQYQLWQLGRTRLRFNHYARLLAQDQEELPEPQRVQLDMLRQYIMIFGWEAGDDAELAFLDGKLTDDELFEMTRDVQQLLEQKGFFVLDNKPRHYIVRTRENGELLKRHGKYCYSLVDFELLIPIPSVSSLFGDALSSH